MFLMWKEDQRFSTVHLLLSLLITLVVLLLVGLRKAVLPLGCVSNAWLHQIQPNPRSVCMCTSLCYSIRVLFMLQFSEADFVLRDPVTHSAQCEELELDSTASRNYGINRNSSLNSLKYVITLDSYSTLAYIYMWLLNIYHILGNFHWCKFLYVRPKALRINYHCIS